MASKITGQRGWGFRVLQFVIGAGILGALIGLIPWFFESLTNDPPNVALVVAPNEGTIPFDVLADANATDPDGDDLTYTWLLNDTVVDEGSMTNHTFRLTEAGQAKLGVVVSDGNGGETQRVQLVRVVRPEREIETTSLSADLEVNLPDHVVRLPPLLVTNGHALDINVHTLVADGSVLAAFNSWKGPSGGPGLNKGQAPNGANGGENPGQDGEPGGPGGDGEAGRSGGTIRIQAAQIVGSLNIRNSGQDGGDGGAGGTGGQGGNGGQGRSASDGAGALGVGNCNRGPGRGGRGGTGGMGGTGGAAGDGGDGGDVSIIADTADFLEIVSVGGSAGMPGSAGTRGAAGDGGREGNSTRYCSSANRHGAPGQRGAPGTSGAEASAGAVGLVTVGIGDIEADGKGTLRYP